jgi:hypothetical protein
MRSAESGDLECVEILLEAGANVDHDANGTALARAHTRGVARRLLDSGADPAGLSQEGRRALLGLPPHQDPALITAAREDFQRAFTRTFGQTNPQPMDAPFWHSMIRSGVSGYHAGQLFSDASAESIAPVWSAQRFGQSITILPDGRIVQIAGEHEDHYDPDFCIYNDVFVHMVDGSIAVYGYPEAVFPPTDFHTATLVGDSVFVIGSLGYPESRRYGETPVFRLDTHTFQMEPVETKGDPPGWLYKHQAVASGPREIRVWGGKVVTRGRENEEHRDNADTFVLDLDRQRWRRASA